MLNMILTSSGESGPGSNLTDPSLLAVFYDYIKLMPMVTEANQMSQELNKVQLVFHLAQGCVSSCNMSHVCQ